ncbi:MAG: TlpA disulfide reductase family protein [Desulfobulbaceae bacterium]|nr:TlpA disulfide reductase family protein [Desulfobulbaceae bacterium]
MKISISVKTAFLFFLLTVLSFFILSCSPDQENLEIGDRAPDFTLKDLDGNTISLSNYTGSPVILRFFLTDCKFCRADTPVFNNYYDRYKSQGLKIIYIDSLGVDRTILTAFKRELAIPFPIAVDPAGRAAGQYKVKAMPQTIILNPQLEIIAAILGGVSEEELNRTLSPYITYE